MTKGDGVGCVFEGRVGAARCGGRPIGTAGQQIESPGDGRPRAGTGGGWRLVAAFLQLLEDGQTLQTHATQSGDTDVKTWRGDAIGRWERAGREAGARACTRLQTAPEASTS